MWRRYNVWFLLLFITFRVIRSEAKCIAVTVVCVSVCLCVCLSLAAFPHYCTDPDETLGNGRGCPLVVHCCADLQSVHRFRCHDNVAPNAKCQRVLVLALCLVLLSLGLFTTLADCRRFSSHRLMRWNSTVLSRLSSAMWIGHNGRCRGRKISMRMYKMWR